MVKLLILADDFTGALDTGVQFAKAGAAPHIITDGDADLNTLSSKAETVVMVTDTRHLPAQAAYEVICQIAARAVGAGIPYLYKKTDSVLRGNIGSELAALLDTVPVPLIPFVPAYPKLRRITRNGTHYIDKTPVSQSVFGQDPFEPVISSDVSEIICQQRRVKVISVREGDPFPRSDGEPKIAVFDADSDQRLRQIGEQAKAAGAMRVMAGCAGFAEFLPSLLGLSHRESSLDAPSSGLLVISGSLNPITLDQIKRAKEAGFGFITLSRRQKTEGFFDSEDLNVFIQQALTLYHTNPRLIIETISEVDDVCHGEDDHQLRQTVAENIGALTAHLVRAGIDGALMITGGDTLRGFMDRMDSKEIIPECEIEPGVVLSRVITEERELLLISKSGGMGGQEVFLNAAKFLDCLLETGNMAAQSKQRFGVKR